MELETVALSPQEAVQRGAEGLVKYGTIFFPKTVRQASPTFHSTIGRVLYDASVRYAAFMVFRDGAKTTLLRIFTSQRIAYAISRTIMFVSISQAHSVLSVRWLKRQVEQNTRWASAFGLVKGDKGTDEWIEIVHTKQLDAEGKPIRINVLAAGITGQIRGFNIEDFRPDLIVCDDISNEEPTATEEQRLKYFDLFFNALANSLAPESEAPAAKMVLLQTPLNKMDIITQCEKDPEWFFLRF